MIFGIDLDGTYAEDVVTFHRIVDVLLAAGHRCVMVTNRCESAEQRRAIVELVHRDMPVLFSCGRPKREVAREAGYAVSVWIDDNPILVDFGGRGLEMVGTYDKGDLIS